MAWVGIQPEAWAFYLLRAGWLGWFWALALLKADCLQFLLVPRGRLLGCLSQVPVSHPEEIEEPAQHPGKLHQYQLGWVQLPAPTAAPVKVSSPALDSGTGRLRT